MSIELPSDISSLLATWDSSSIRYLYAGYILVGVGILSGLGVTAFTEMLPKIWIKILGFLAAGCTAILASYQPIESGNAFRDAWRVLNKASVEYKLVEASRDPAKLVAAMEEGERIIARIKGPNNSGTSAASE